MALNFDSLTVDGSGRVSFSGLSSGIDFVAAVDNIIKARRVPIDSLEKRVDQNELRIAALGDLQSGLRQLQESLSRLYGAVSFGNSRDIFEAKNAFASTSRSDGQAASQANALLGVSVTNAAATGTHTLEVLQTARAHKVSTDAVSSTATALGFSNGDKIVLNGELAYRSAAQASGSSAVGSTGTIAFTDPVSGDPIGAVDYAADTTLSQLASKITNEVDGVSAKVVTENGQARLEITSATRFTMAESGGGSALADLGIEDRNTITLSAGDTLLDLRDRINNANKGANKIGVTASIISAGTNEHYLVLTRDATGAAMAIKDTAGSALADIGVLKGDGTIKNHLQSAAKAQFYADGLLDLSNTKYESAVQSGAATQLGSSGTLGFTRDGDGAALGSVAYTADMTLQQLADAITAEIDGVSAKIVAEGNGVRLAISGEDAFSIAESGGGNALADLGVGNARRLIERSSNTVSDLWSGVTLNLFQAEKGTSIQIEIERDLAEVKQAVAGFVDAYNNLRGFINLQRTKPGDISGEEAEAAGILISSNALKEVDTMLGRVLGQGALGVDRNFSVLAQIGINFVDNNRLDNPLLANTLDIDEAKLDEALLNNPDEIRRLFAFDFSASDSRIGLLGFNRHTSFNPNGYTLHLQPNSGDNLLAHSEQADADTYTPIRASVAADVIAAPDGSMTADGLVADATDNTHLLTTADTMAVTAGESYTFSSYVKMGTRDTARLAIAGGPFGGNQSFADFNLQSGAIAAQGPGIDAAHVEDAGDGWYRVSVTATAQSDGNMALERSTRQSGQNSFVGADDPANPELYLWGAQLERAGAANLRVTDLDGVRATAGTSDSVVGPNGLPARQIEASTEDNSHFVLNAEPFTVTAGEDYETVAYVKAGSQPKVRLQLAGANFETATRADFDLTDGTITNLGAGAADATIEPADDGFYKITVRGTASGDGNAHIELYALPESGVGFVGADDPDNPETYFADLRMVRAKNDAPGDYVPSGDGAAIGVVPSANVDGDATGADDGSAKLSGNDITVLDGGAKGLKLFHSGFDNQATIQVNFTLGIAAQLNFAIERLVEETTGIIDSEKTVLADQNELSEKRIDEMMRRLEDQRQNMLDRFIRMETALASAQRILDSIKQTTEMMLASQQR